MHHAGIQREENNGNIPVTQFGERITVKLSYIVKHNLLIIIIL